MSKRMYWGVATLIILLGTAFVFMTIRDRAEIAELKRESADFEKMKAESNQPQTAEVVESRQPPPNASPTGHWHGDEWHDESHVVPISQENVNTTPVSLNKSEGTSLYSRVAASDAVPKFAELKQMRIEELRTLLLESYAKAKSFDPEVEKRWDAWAEVPAASDKGKALEASLNAILKEQFVHQITGSRASKVCKWLDGIESSKTPQLVVSWTLPEPFDE